ncbi:MAG: DUF4349 domain-containing protein [Anaerolineae bacterium]|nr:DUF4349 domain-containing protein [Anaerolineae bacterium]
MKRGNLLFLVILLALAASVLISCGSASAPAQKPVEQADSSFGVAREVAPALPTQVPAPVEMPRQPAMGEAFIPAAEDRMIIRTGEIVGRFQDVREAVEEAQSLVQGAGGYVVTSNVWASGDDLNANMSVRVPAERFDDMMESLAGLAAKVERTSTSGDDVTEEYYDLEARLRALRATEEQLLLLLEDVRERMETAEDILAVYRELQNIQSQIEQHEGRRQFLERMVAMSTINLTLLAVEAEAPVISGTWNPMSTLRSALRALTDTGQFLLDALIWIVFYLVPVLAVMLIPLVLLIVGIKAVVRGRAARRASASGQGETPAT